MGLRAIVAMGVLLCATTARSQTTRCETFPPGGYVGVYADSLAQDSLIVLTPVPGGWLGSFYIIAVLNGAVGDGIAGAALRVHLPLAIPTPFVTMRPNPEASVWLGQPVATGTDPGGLIVGWPRCQDGRPVADGKRVVQIARVDMFCLAAIDTPIYVKKLSNPDTRAPCPIFSKCDAPLFTPAPMILRGTDVSGEDYAFSGRLFCDGGTVSLRTSSWGRVKALYR